jgi:hypothetical protein
MVLDQSDGERAQGVPFGMRRQHYLQLIWSIVEYLKRAHELATKLSKQKCARWLQ